MIRLRARRNRTCMIVSALSLATMFQALTHLCAEMVHALPHVAARAARSGKTGMTERRTRACTHAAVPHHRMAVMRAFRRHHMLAELGGDFHFRAFATDAERDFIAFLLRADQSLELLQIHDPLIAEHHEHVVFFKAGHLRRAVFHHVGDEKPKALRQTALRGEFR